MSAAFIASWTGAGIVVGTALGVHTRRLLTLAPSWLVMPGLVATLTAGAFGLLAWRFGNQFDLLPYVVLASVGIALGLIDLIDQRLPSELVYSCVLFVGGLLATSAVLHSRGPDLLRALAGMAILVGFYLVLAMASGGGLGAGDVKLGGLLGLSLGWLGWSALITGTFLGWLAAALVWLIFRVMQRRPRGALLPMGPFLVLGALLAIGALPA